MAIINRFLHSEDEWPFAHIGFKNFLDREQCENFLIGLQKRDVNSLTQRELILMSFYHDDRLLKQEYLASIQNENPLARALLAEETYLNQALSSVKAAEVLNNLISAVAEDPKYNYFLSMFWLVRGDSNRSDEAAMRALQAGSKIARILFLRRPVANADQMLMAHIAITAAQDGYIDGLLWLGVSYCKHPILKQCSKLFFQICEEAGSLHAKFHLLDSEIEEKLFFQAANHLALIFQRFSQSAIHTAVGENILKKNLQALINPAKSLLHSLSYHAEVILLLEEKIQIKIICAIIIGDKPLFKTLFDNHLELVIAHTLSFDTVYIEPVLQKSQFKTYKDARSTYINSLQSELAKCTDLPEDLTNLITDYVHPDSNLELLPDSLERSLKNLFTQMTLINREKNATKFDLLLELIPRAIYLFQSDDDDKADVLDKIQLIKAQYESIQTADLVLDNVYADVQYIIESLTQYRALTPNMLQILWTNFTSFSDLMKSALKADGNSKAFQQILNLALANDLSAVDIAHLSQLKLIEPMQQLRQSILDNGNSLAKRALVKLWSNNFCLPKQSKRTEKFFGPAASNSASPAASHESAASSSNGFANKGG